MSFLRTLNLTVMALYTAIFVCVAPAVADEPSENSGTVTVKTSDGQSHNFSVELALTHEARQRGLMFRREMAPDHGMLFIFPDVNRRSFWMKNTYIPLDIIFIKANGQIANIVANAEPETLTARRSKGRALAVLELIGGRAADLGIKAGDVVYHPLIGSEEPSP